MAYYCHRIIGGWLLFRNKNMAKGTSRIKTRTKIVGATMTAIFSLASVFTATLAWFATNTSVSATNMMVSVVNDSIVIESVSLCKFLYPSVNGIFDYLRPGDGEVVNYYYNEEEESYGYDDEHDDFVSVDAAMNLFDPVDIEIGGTLINQYCNAIYVITISANQTSAGLEVFANRFSKVKTHDSDIYLSDCVDFDIYTEADLAAVTGKGYYPDHIDNPESVTLDGYDEIFYKIAYLSSNEASHAHFYGTNPKPSRVAIHNPASLKTLTFSAGTATFYINVNYSPAQLAKYATTLANSNRNGIFDYSFFVDLDLSI